MSVFNGTKSKKSVSGFTLIELLVVIAIIGMLFSILLPSLHKARKASKRAVCFANLKTYQTGTHGYLLANHNKFPHERYNTIDNHQGRSWIGKKGSNYQWPLEVTEKPLNEYIGLTVDGVEAPQMECPFNDDDVDVYHKVGSSYVGNEYNVWTSLGGRFLSQINTPSKVVLSTEFGAVGYLINESSSYWRQTHFTGVARYPFAKIDGSVLHHKVRTQQGISISSDEIILNLDYD
ncbi:MAG: type II secretion system GspH family protein [Lentisphaeraceae bacterium]|nr:type II secretion system GspH family protein [Lentisphaeraceae bacterium]